MAKIQLKQNQLYLIKLKIVKVVTSLEIIQPQLGNYSTTVFDRRTLFSFWQKKIKKKSKIGNPFPPQTWKWRFKGQIDFWFLRCGDIHALVKAFSLVYFTICVNLLLPHIYLSKSVTNLAYINRIPVIWKKEMQNFVCQRQECMHLKVERNGGLTFITAFRISTRRTRTHNYFMVLWMWIREWVV